MAETIEIRFEQSGLTKGRHALARFTREILRYCQNQTGHSGATLSIMYCSDEAIRRLNHRFRGIDKATDVLSFPAYEPEESTGGSISYDHTNPAYAHFGDLAISLATVDREAREEGKDLLDHIALMLVHGYLHLLGYDHDTEERESRMWAETDRLMACLATIEKPEILLEHN